ncbi:MAG TPA: hypothetical protein VFV23_01955 [Verrucomicrobiae bacterium]|nr:hypothetical protein [Verrucomicrobiae bacterium]
MRRLLPVFLLLIAGIAAFAARPEYVSLRHWVEKQNPNDKTPAQERIFVNGDWKESAIVRCHNGMTLQEVFYQTKLKGKFVLIYRSGHKPAGEPVYNEADADIVPNRKSIIVQPLDVIYLWNGKDGKRN